MTGTVADLGRHLEETYGLKVTWMTPLEPWAPDGVQRVDLEGGDSWVARSHGPARPVAAVHGDAEILRFLERHDFPAERLAHPEPVSTYDSVSVIVTKLLPGENCRSDSSRATINGIGRLLGRLHTLPATEGAVSRPAGGWHHLSGRGPRVQSMGTLGWVGHPSLIDAFVAGYREHSALEPEELDRLDRALVAHGLILQAWGVAFRGAMPSAILQWLAAERKTTELVVERARQAFEAPP
jgi:Ser/Thr protein kinase RdoA (MazF antagonist)